jgi:hypothetical protein
MKHAIPAAFAAAALAAGAAYAQTTTTSTTTQVYTPPAYVAQVTPAPVAPPEGTLSTTRETHSEDAYGDQRYSKTTTYRNSNGVAQDSKTVTTTVPAPPPPPVSTTTTTTESTTTEPR